MIVKIEAKLLFFCNNLQINFNKGSNLSKESVLCKKIKYLNNSYLFAFPANPI